MRYYIHHVPGRLRIETPSLHGDPKKGDEFKSFLKELKGIADVEVHAVTGSAIIHFDEKEIDCEKIIGILEKHGYFRLADAETCDDVIEKTTKKVVEVAEQVIVDSIEGGMGA